MARNGSDCFEELAAAVLDGTADEEACASFRRLLDASPERVADYMRQARIHVMLESCAGLRKPSERRPSFCDACRRVWRPVAAAALMMIGLSVGSVHWLRCPAPGTSSKGIVTVRASRHGQWADGREVVVGTTLAANVWAWQSGLVELVTGDGTVLLVEAPAALEMVNPLYARLISGNIVVRMPKGRSGFVVETPRMKVFDLGTEFGVTTLPGGESKVQVFDGKVRAETSDSMERKELYAGETVKATVGGRLEPDVYNENRFIRRFPLVVNPERPSGVLYSRSRVETVQVVPAKRPVAVDGELTEWDCGIAFKSACDAPYAETYWLEGMMAYDKTNLYLAAHVGDPDPMCNRAPEGFEFAGGSVIVRVSADKKQGWPLKGTLYVNGRFDYSRSRIGSEARSGRIASMVLWYDAQVRCARLKLIHGLDDHAFEIDPPGWKGVFRKDADGRGYRLEYAIPWSLLNCADDPPKGGDELAALWMAHWSDADGRIARGQLVEVTNHQPHPQDNIPPYIFFQNGPSWGKAKYLPKGE